MKQVIYILIFIVGLNFAGKAQTNTETPVKIISAYPTPASTVIHFDFLPVSVPDFDRSSSIFQIYNFPGSKVYELRNVPQKITLPLHSFFRGIYYYKLVNRQGKTIESGRFLVIK